MEDSSNKLSIQSLLKLNYHSNPISKKSVNSCGSEIRLYHKGSTRLVIRRYHRTSTSKPLFKARFLLQRVYGSKAWNDYTSSSSRFKKVKHLYQQPIIQDGVPNGATSTCELYGKFNTLFNLIFLEDTLLFYE
ncbi:hypothetical protein ACTFIR_005740 [Dictyostelium discoideum]